MAQPRTRKTVAERKAELLKQREALLAVQRKKQKQLDARLAQLDAREKTQARKRDSHVKFIFGAGVMAHARINAAFAKQLYDVLHKATTMKDRDVKLIEDWLKPFAKIKKPRRKIVKIVPPAKQQEG